MTEERLADLEAQARRWHLPRESMLELIAEVRALREWNQQKDDWICKAVAVAGVFQSGGEFADVLPLGSETVTDGLTWALEQIRALRAQLSASERYRAEDAADNLGDLQVWRDNRDGWKQRAEQAESSLAAMTEERDALQEMLKCPAIGHTTHFCSNCGNRLVARAALEGSK